MNANEWIDANVRRAERVNQVDSINVIWHRMKAEAGFHGTLADAKAILAAAGHEPASTVEGYPYYRIEPLQRPVPRPAEAAALVAEMLTGCPARR